VRIVRTNILPTKGFDAINLMGVLFVHRNVYISKLLVNHERIHTAQMRELLYVGFYVWYLLEWFVRLFMKGNAYRNISFEREAYYNEQNLGYLRNRPHYAWCSYLKKNMRHSTHKRTLLIAVALITNALCMVARTTAPADSLKTADRMRQAVTAMATHPDFRHASLGIAVFDLQADTMIAANQPDLSITTASTMKTLSSAAALSILGSDYTFQTPVYLDGELKKDKFKGNIIIYGSGDPVLGSKYLPNQADITAEIIRALQALGIKKLEGTIDVRDTYYPLPHINDDWCAGDLAWYYAAGVHALNFCDNTTRLRFTVDSATLAVSPFTLAPAVPGVQVINLAKAAPSGDFAATVEYATPAIVLMGNLRPKRYDQLFTNPTPNAMLADSLRRSLIAAGFKVKDNAKARAKVKHPERRRLLTHNSAPLGDIVTSLLDRSDNVFAHALLLAIGANQIGITPDNGDLPRNLSDVAKQKVTQFLDELGVEQDGLWLYDGSGLARPGKASAKMLAEMLVKCEKKGIPLRQHMPTAGKRVGDNLVGTPLSNDIVLKSGSMSQVQCFVGYYPADAPRYTFAVLANDYNCSRAEIKNHIANLLIQLFNP